MNLQRTQDHQDLMSAAGELADRLYQSERPSGERFLQDWTALADLGVFSLCAPEPDGLALKISDATLVYEQLGRALVTPAAITTHLVSGHLPGAFNGSCVVGHAFTAGGRVLVQDHDRLTHVLVGHKPGRGMTIHTMSDVNVVEVLDPVDPLVSIGVLDIPGNQEPAVNLEASTSQRTLLDELLLQASYQVGIAQAVLDRAVVYSQQREQFGRPIGSFQALKHLMADMLVRLEIARSAVLGAAVAADEDDADAERLTVSAKMLADRAATVNARTAIQIHGGMGFAWGVDIHLFLKRAWSGATIPVPTSQLVSRLEALRTLTPA